MSATAVRAAKQDVADVLVRYASSIDRRDWERLVTCFTDPCDVEYEGAGAWTSPADMAAFMTDAHASMGHTLHRLATIDVAVDDALDRARARSYVDAVLMAPDGLSGINSVGWYDDELVPVDDGWRIARRRFTAVRLLVIGAEGDLLH